MPQYDCEVTATLFVKVTASDARHAASMAQAMVQAIVTHYGRPLLAGVTLYQVTVWDPETGKEISLPEGEKSA